MSALYLIVVITEKSYSFDGGESSSESEMGASKINHTSTGATIETSQLPASVPFYPPRLGQDLISLVEKGRVGMSSNSSCCSSTTSSIGEKHGVPATKISTQVNESTVLK